MPPIAIFPRLTLLRSLLGRLLMLTFALALGLHFQINADATSVVTSHNTRGLIRKINSSKHTLVVRHDPIPNYMPAMTMELTVQKPREMDSLQAGDWIEFRLNANQDKHWIDQIKKIAAPAPSALSNSTNAPSTVSSNSFSLFPTQSLKPGDPVPDARLTDEHGRTFTLSSLRGKTIALTFIFTRCPLPDFCPLMNRNFARTRSLLQNQPAAPTNWTFLSISFDSAYDTPEVLQKYARIYRGNDDSHWTFAAGEPAEIRRLGGALNLLVQNDGATYSHNLRTVVLTPDGAIHRQFDGNLWKAQDLAQAITEAASKSTRP